MDDFHGADIYFMGSSFTFSSLKYNMRRFKVPPVVTLVGKYEEVLGVDMN